MSRVFWFKICLISATLTVVGIASVGHIVASSQSNERREVFVGNAAPVPGVSHSDDYVWHSRQFQRAARDLIARGDCGEDDFTTQAGFARAGSAEKPASPAKTYVIRCSRQAQNREISLTVVDSGDYELN